MELIQKIQEEFKVFEEKKKALAEQLQQEFPQILAPLFEKSKKINSVSWRQYTPYFNDGDTCEFGVYNDDLDVNGESNYDLDWWSWEVKWYLKGEDKYKNIFNDNPSLDLEECKVYMEFIEVLTSIPDDFYKDLFGDHVEVTVLRDGRVEVDGYEHD